MKKRLLLLASCIVCFCTGIHSKNLSGTDIITGQRVCGIDITETYSAGKNDAVSAYKWIAPTGCKITEGQGTENVTIQTTYLSRDSHIGLIREFNGGGFDTLSLDITFHRPISIIKDHTIAPGESIEIAGEVRTVADIYYEYDKDDNGRDLITAHRLTLEPKAGVYAKMTKPYLQSLTENSVWICWKTDYDSESVVMFGEELPENKEEGSAEKLSDTYFWHSVHLTGLKPNTFYSYKVKSGDTESEVYRFKTAPETGSKASMRILLMGDHQIKSRSGYEWLMQAAKRKIEEKYGKVEENIDMIMNVGDQVDVGTLDHYEHIHLYKSELFSPYLSIMTAVGNHETYNDPGMANYAAHFHYEELEYQGISSGTENYYAYQIGRILFLVMSTEHPGNEQKAWVQKVVDAAKEDDSVDFLISVNHRPIQAEQYIGDISYWVRDEIVPILVQTEKHIFNYGGHHHLYHRGQWADYPFYHIINGAASWDQMWGMSSEKDFDDVQKTIDYWAYQILEFDFEKKEMRAECYAIGNKELVVDNILIDKFHRKMGKAAPEKPVHQIIEKTITLPYTFVGNEYKTATDEAFNTTQFQISTSEDFTTLALNVVRDVENLYGSTGRPFHIPVDIHEFTDITRLTVDNHKLKNGTHYIRLRYRDENLEWSDWSDVQMFTVEGSIDGDPAISMEKNTFALNEDIIINYEFAPVGQNAWIGIYHYGENPGTSTPSTRWAYTEASAGSCTFSLNEADEYYAVLFEDEGYTEAGGRIAFYAGDIPLLSIEKTSFEVNEPVVIRYSNAPGLSSDWIGIYKMGNTPGNEYSVSWNYTASGSTEGEMSLSLDTKGFYFVNYFTRGGYFEPSERQYISIGSDISSLSADTLDFCPDEDIIIYYSNGPGTPKDWIGIFKEKKVVGVDELDGFYYTYGETDGYITIPAGEHKADDYFLALYINDSYDEVSPRIHITIGKSPELIFEKETEEFVTIGFTEHAKWRNNIESILINGEKIAVENYSAGTGKITIARNIFGTEAGEYTVTVKSKDWQDTSVKVKLELETSIGTFPDQEFRIYPNPVNDYLYISGTNAGTATIYDISGKTAGKYDITEGGINLGRLEKGTYIIRIEYGNEVVIAKMVKE